ncbi:DHH family phosphoesterase [Campylobacter concisus]|uniref:DHH family phosphoesterase n=1 Tax=Campylobacter concisus TaxID=199 RepID=UPI00122CB238|nr:DHH family phosphoesterase [Campylobacter concisus]
MATVNEYLRKLQLNQKENQKQIDEYIKELKKNEGNGKFKIPVGKIDCFYENILDKIRNGKGVLIYSDYDVDGIFSCVMMIETLQHIAKQELDKDPNNTKIKDFFEKLRFKIPTRTEGYGISADYIKAALKSNIIDYIITCDNGTQKSVVPIVTDENYKNKVFVFDHHANGDFGNYDNILNPNTDGKVEISTGILLYRFFEKLSSRKKIELPNLADLAAFTAVADVASLDSNRDIIEQGLNIINNAGISYTNASKEIDKLGEKVVSQIRQNDTEKAYKNIAKIEKLNEKQGQILELANLTRPFYKKLFQNRENITTKDLSFSAIPLINALNRLEANSNFLVKMLQIKQENEANNNMLNSGIYILNGLNNKRKELAFEATKNALQNVKEKGLEKDPLIFVYVENTKIGLCGLIAQRIFDNTGADVIVGTDVNDKIIFSGRGNNVFDNLTRLMNFKLEAKDIFSFGGHLKALGGSIKDHTRFNELLKEALASNIFISNKNTTELDLAKDSFNILEKPVSLFEYNELSKHLTKITGAIPYSKNFLAPVIITSDMILNKDAVMGKAKQKDFVLLKLAVTDPINDKTESIDFICPGKNALDLIENSENVSKNNKLPIFLMELSNNNFDFSKDTFSGKIVFKEQLIPENFLEKIKKNNVQEQKVATSIKI